jgi:hypothetical protein
VQISETSLALGSSRAFRQELEVRERLEVWNRPAGDGRPGRDAGVQVSLSSEAQAAAGGAAAIENAAEAAENDPMLRLLRAVIEWMTGRPVEVFDQNELAADRRPALPALGETSPRASGSGFGLAWDYHARYREEEQTRFAAEGIVRTADGREIRFSVQLEMRRSFELEVRESLRLGTAVRKDPLVINFAGSAAQLSDQRFRLDLDSDGSIDEAHFVAAGSGFLVFDRNGDGQVNDGGELFGARSGNGFADLAALDDDRNGWIDAGDRAFSALRVWIADAGGNRSLRTLAEVGIGALFTGSVQSEFALRDSANATLGDIRRSGVYLYEDGRVGTMQQVDLAV